MSASKVDPGMMRALLSTEIDLEDGGEETTKILRVMHKCGIRRYGDLIQRPQVSVQVLVGTKVYLELMEQLVAYKQHGFPLTFGMDTNKWGWDPR